MTMDRSFDSTAYGRGYKDGKRDAAAEIARLKAGGCARDQGLTQYCAEAAAMAAENERLRAALAEIIPHVHNLAACLNVLGLELTVKKGKS
jgi:hypothetical protein